MSLAESVTPVLLPMAIPSSLILIAELPDYRGFIEGAGVILVRPPIKVLPLTNKMSWAWFTCGKDIGCDYKLEIELLNIVI
jgi:hypothetical protein